MVGRPTGVTILAVLAAIAGVLLWLTGVFAIVVGAAASGMLTGWLSGLRFLLEIVGGLMIIMSIILFLDSWGLYSGKRWSWYLTVIILVLSIISSLFTLMAAAVHSILSIIVDVVLLYYLTRLDVRIFFQI